MTRYHLVPTVFLACLWTSAARGAEPLPTPFPTGIALHHKLCETMVTGPYPGKMRSLICDLAGRPSVLVYAREIDPAVVAMLRKLDVVAQQGKEQKMLSSCVLLTKTDDDTAALRIFTEREELQATIIAHHPLQDHGYYFGSNPTRHRLPSEAVLIVIVLQKTEGPVELRLSQGRVEGCQHRGDRQGCEQALYRGKSKTPVAPPDHPLHGAASGNWNRFEAFSYAVGKIDRQVELCDDHDYRPVA